MKAKLSITRKILLFWGTSILMVVALVGGIFLFSLQSYHSQVANEKIANGFVELVQFTNQRRTIIRNLGQDFASRKAVVSTMNLLSKYQDPQNYDPLVYDGEKRKLAGMLDGLSAVSEHYYIAVYDAKERLSAFYGNGGRAESLPELIAYMTYENGEPVLMQKQGDQDVFARGGHIPNEIPTAGFGAEGEVFLLTDHGLAMVSSFPIQRERRSGNIDELGMAIIIDVIDDRVVNRISQQTGLNTGISYQLDDQAYIFGKTGLFDALPDASQGVFQSENSFEVQADDSGYLGISQIKTAGEEYAQVVLQTPNADLMTGISAFRDSAIWGLAIFMALMTPMSFLFARKVFAQPLSLLMEGVEHLSQGRNGEVVSLRNNDEFGVLAVAFNNMSSAIKEREDGLEDAVHQRTQKLKEAEAKTRQIVNAAVDGIVTTDEKGVITSFNGAAEKIFGYSVVEVIGKNVSMLMPQSHAEHHGEHMTRYLSGGKPKVIGKSRELAAKKKDGTTFLADFSISDFRQGDGVTFVGIIRDITERKEAEFKLQSTLKELQDTQTELVEAEKMASLGGLVAGVAHEINTPIGVGLTAATHLKEKTTDLMSKLTSGQLKKSDLQRFGEAATQSTDIVETNLNRAAELISSFKQVAVDQTSDERRQINLLDYFDEVLQSLHPKLKKTKHHVSFEGNRDIVIDTVPGPLSQVITNLVMNSVIHAFDEDDEGHIVIEAKRNEKSISIQYSDDGKGMDEEVRSKIFEPFFTTKRGSGGSGLGMHILYNQITQTLGGSVTCASTPGQGTVFSISLPIEVSESGQTVEQPVPA